MYWNRLSNGDLDWTEHNDKRIVALLKQADLKSNIQIAMHLSWAAAIFSRHTHVFAIQTLVWYSDGSSWGFIYKRLDKEPNKKYSILAPTSSWKPEFVLCALRALRPVRRACSYFNVAVDAIRPKTDFTLETNRKKWKKNYWKVFKTLNFTSWTFSSKP